MRFCSRCGLAISEVANWLAGVGAQDAQPAALSVKRRGVRHGAKIMFWGGALAPLFFVLSLISDSPAPLFIPAIILLAGFSVLLYSRLFGEDVPPGSVRELRSGSHPTNALPPASDTGVGGLRGARTAEMVQPPSVTDPTTKLLKDK